MKMNQIVHRQTYWSKTVNPKHAWWAHMMKHSASAWNHARVIAQQKVGYKAYIDKHNGEDREAKIS